ncbi:MAG: NAD(+) kinase [Bacteroidales bacterium]|nr:NAD(+) kinase [Bacteroidales bacterium]
MEQSIKIAILGREVRSGYRTRLTLLLDELSSRRVSFVWYAPFLEQLSKEGLRTPPGEIFTSSEDLPDDVSLFLSLGGDGTFLSSITYVRDRGIPVAGINFGRLGFLTTAKVGKEPPLWIDDLLEGRYSLEQRDLLRIDCDSVPGDFYPYALNEISIHRQGPAMLSMTIKIDGRPLPVYRADGIVIATPTGSTAYSLSVGGPIVTPDSEVLIISPIAPHNLNVRPLVVPLTSTLELTLSSGDEPAIVTMDNRSFTLPSGGSALITRGEFPFVYVSLFDNHFIKAIQDKLLWGEDKRNDI